MNTEFLIKFIRRIAFIFPRDFRKLAFFFFPKLGERVLGRSYAGFDNYLKFAEISNLFKIIGYAKFSKIANSRIAIIGPTAPIKSGIAWNTTLLRMHLKKFEDIDFFQSPVVETKLYEENGFFPLFALNAVLSFWTYDEVLVVIGNGNHYSATLEIVNSLPELRVNVLLHDIRITGINTGEELNFSSNYGLNKLPISTKTVLVHSKHAKEIVERELIDRNVKVALIDCGAPIEYVTKQPRLTPQEFIVGSAGFFDFSKDPIRTLHIFIEIAKKDKEFKFEWVGEINSKSKAMLMKIWNDNNISKDRIRFLGYVSDEEFRIIISRWVFGIQLRKTSNGESSGVVKELAAQGTPVVVSNLGSFSELPDNLFFKIDTKFNHIKIAEYIHDLVKCNVNDWLNLSNSLVEWSANSTFEKYSEEIYRIIQDKDLK